MNTSSTADARSATTTIIRRTKAPLWQRYFLVILWLTMAGVFVAINPGRFLSLPVALGVFSSSDVYVFLGLAVMLTLYVGEIDLSVPFTLGLAATLVPTLHSVYGVPVVLAAGTALVAAVLVGVVNATLVVRVGVDPMIVTLGIGTVVLGIALAVSGEQPRAGLPSWYTSLATARFLGFTVTFWTGLALALVLAYVIYRTPLGRRMTFVGANREVARLAGIAVSRVRSGSYIFSALIAGLGGVFVVARLGGFDASASTSYLLPAFATAFVSAAVITLGRFNPIGVLIGAYFISTGTLGLQLLGLTGWVQQVFYGLALVIAVTLVTVVRKRGKV